MVQPEDARGQVVVLIHVDLHAWDRGDLHEVAAALLRAGLEEDIDLDRAVGREQARLLVVAACACAIAEDGCVPLPDRASSTDSSGGSPDESVELADHAMDATRYSLHGELGEAARAVAYLAAMQRRLQDLRGQLEL